MHKSVPLLFINHKHSLFFRIDYIVITLFISLLIYIHPVQSESSNDSASQNIHFTDTSTLSDYQHYAEIHNPELQSAIQNWKAAKERVRQIYALPDPQLSYSFEDMGSGLKMFQHRFEVSQMFPWFGKRGLMRDQAKIESDMAEQKYQEMKFKLSSMVTMAYAEWYYLSREIAVTEENMKLVSYFERVARSKYTVGTEPQSAVIKAQVELGMLEVDLQSLRDLEEPTRAKLNAVLNRPLNEPLPIVTTLPEIEITVPYDRLVSQVQERNPSIKALTLESSAKTKDIFLAKKRYYPDFMLGVGTEKMAGPLKQLMETNKNSLMGMFSINLPIWRHSYRSGVQEANFQLNSIVMEQKNLENEFLTELKKVWYEYHNAERKMKLYHDSLIPKAKQSLTISQKEFESGMSDFLDLIDGQRTLLEFELNYEKALTDRLQYYSQIEQLTGMNEPVEK
jgi:outer membrane protein, heavy metal efflux system